MAVFATLYLIGNGEVESSILSRSTSYSNRINVLEKLLIPQSSILKPYATLALAAQSPHTVKQQQSCGEWLLAEKLWDTDVDSSQAKAGDVEKFRTTPISSTIGSLADLPNTITTVLKAVDAGELDTELAAASKDRQFVKTKVDKRARLMSKNSNR